MPEVIPELALVVGLFFALVGYITARGLLATWTHSLGYVFAWLGKHTRLPIPTGIRTFHVDLGEPFRAIDGWVVSALQAWCDGAEIQMGYCLHGMRKVALFTAQAIDILSRETSETFDWLRHVSLPKWAKWAALAAFPPALLAKLIAHAVANLSPQILKTVKTIEHAVPQKVVQVFKYAGAAAIPGVIGLPKVWSEIHGLTKRWARINARLHRLEALLGVTAMAAAMANVLGLPNWRCLTRGNIGRVSRALCGLGPRALEDLLGLIADVLILQNICTVITLMEDGFKLIEPALTGFIVTAETQFVHCGYDLPTIPKLDLPYLPPVTGVVLNQAA